jgi:ion channel-forming bestrophin family protein
MVPYERGHWLRMVLRTHGSVVREVMPRVITATLISIVVMLVQTEFPVLRRSLTTTPFLLTALPLGIILGFRNSSSYERFWEARKVWGALVNATRNFTRQTDALLRAPNETKKRIAYRIIAAVHALRHTLRGETDLADLAPFIDESERTALVGEVSPASVILHHVGRDIGEAFAKGQVDAQHVTLIETSLMQITDAVGACERIKRTPTPISYVIFIHRSVALYSFLLPFGVLETVKTLTPVVVFFVSYAFFSLDAIGDELDDPFRYTPNALPISALARSIEIFIRRRLGETDIPPQIEAVDGVLS